MSRILYYYLNISIFYRFMLLLLFFSVPLNVAAEFPNQDK